MAAPLPNDTSFAVRSEPSSGAEQHCGENQQRQVLAFLGCPIPMISDKDDAVASFQWETTSGFTPMTTCQADGVASPRPRHRIPNSHLKWQDHA